MRNLHPVTTAPAQSITLPSGTTATTTHLPGDLASISFQFSGEDAAFLDDLATKLDLTRQAFVEAFISDELPRQSRHRQIPGEVTADTLKNRVACARLKQRLARAATFNRMAPDELLLGLIRHGLEKLEAQMIFAPDTGEIVGDARRVHQVIKVP